MKGKNKKLKPQEEKRTNLLSEIKNFPKVKQVAVIKVITEETNVI